MQNVFLHDHKESLPFLKDILKGFSKKFLIVSLKVEKQMNGSWRLTMFMEEK